MLYDESGVNAKVRSRSRWADGGLVRVVVALDRQSRIAANGMERNLWEDELTRVRAVR